MFENCTIKYAAHNGVNIRVKIIHPRKDDGSIYTITAPIDEENRHYQEIQKWVAEGNTIEEAD